MDETKAVYWHQKNLSNEAGAFQRQQLFKEDDVRWISTIQKKLDYLEAVEKWSAHSDNVQDPAKTTETSLMMTNDETIETEDGKQAENQNSVEANASSDNPQGKVKAPQQPPKEKPNTIGISVVSLLKNPSGKTTPMMSLEHWKWAVGPPHRRASLDDVWNWKLKSPRMNLVPRLKENSKS